MTEKADIDSIAREATENEPPRTQEATGEHVENAAAAAPGHPVDIADFAGAGVAIIDGAMRFSFGDKGALDKREVEGVTSLLQRISEYFGMTKYIAGGKGLFLMTLGKIFGMIFPRLADEQARTHFMRTYFNRGDNVDTARNRESETAAASAAE